MVFFSVLDPRISYEGVLQDYADNPDLLVYLESMKDLLCAHFNKHYAGHAHSLNRAADTHIQAASP